MRVPQQILDCIGYISRKKKGGGYKIFGTAFFVSVPSATDIDSKFHYLITAKHLVDDTNAEQGELHVRLNTSDGGAEHVRLNGEWSFPQDGQRFDTDAAVIRFIPKRDYFVYKPIPIEGFLGHPDFRIPPKRASVGVGDDLMIMGLFIGHHGKSRNIPIVRFGTIAAMPGELLESTYSKKPHQSYVIESRSLGGLSGSPVFLIVEPPEGMESRERPHDYAVLGLIRSYWYYDIESAKTVEDKREKFEVNAGISAVTPSQKILEIVYGQKLAMDREEEDKARVLP